MKIILADSSDVVRIGLRTILKTKDDIEIIGEAKDNDQLGDQLDTYKTDVVLIDYTAEGFDIEEIKKLAYLHKYCKFVGITEIQNPHIIVRALQSGIYSHVKKDCDVQEIIDSVRESAAGQKFFCGKILESISNENISLEELNLSHFTCEPLSISEREEEVIRLIAEGNTNAEIAEKLCLSGHTVNTHRKNILSKLGVKNTAGIVIYAVKTGLISPNKYLFA